MTALAGGAIGAALFLAVFGTGLLRVSNLGWMMRHDLQTYLLAWHHFRRTPWQWPLGRLDAVGYPVGTSIGSTDAVPLVALILKPWHAWLPDPMQYFGGWLLLCFVLQGVFGLLLTRVWTTDWRLQLLGAGLFVQVPALLVRTGHPALCAHWTLLAALWLCVDRAASPTAKRISWVTLCALAAATQPYLAVVVVAVGLADGATRVWRSRATRGVVLDVAVPAVAALVVVWQAGHFRVGGATDLELEGLGFYSMNLFGPVIALGNSSLLPAVPAATPGQYEGYVYFGAGWLLLAVLALALAVVGRGRAPAFGLAWVVVVGCAVLALSPVISAGSRVIADLGAWAPHQLAVFRSSGRFGWLTMYAAFVTIVATLVSAVPARAAAWVLAVGVVLQAVDLSGAYAALHAREHSSEWTTYDNPLRSPVWDLALPHYRHLVMAPPDMCVTVWPSPAGPHLPFSLRAGGHGVTINSGNAGRYDIGAVLGYCRSLETEVRAGRLADDSLYVVSPAVREVLAAAEGVPAPVCGRLDGFVVCGTAASVSSWAAADATAAFAPLR